MAQLISLLTSRLLLSSLHPSALPRLLLNTQYNPPLLITSSLHRHISCFLLLTSSLAQLIASRHCFISLLNLETTKREAIIHFNLSIPCPFAELHLNQLCRAITAVDEVAVGIIARGPPPVGHGTIIDRVTIIKAATTVVKAAMTIDIAAHNGEGLAGDGTNEVSVGEGMLVETTEVIRLTRRYPPVKNCPTCPRKFLFQRMGGN